MSGDLLLFNGRFHTMDAGAPLASAVAVRGGRILFVGDEPGARAALGDARAGSRYPQCIDLGGRCAVPGLTDAHIHFKWYAEALAAVDAETATLDQALDRVRERAGRTAPGSWIYGSGWNHNVWASDGREGVLPTRLHLDSAAPANPVAMEAKSGHALWVSSRALAAAGITRKTRDPEGGTIVRDAAGEPTGILLEKAMRLVQAVLPAPSPAGLADLMLAAQKAAHRAGLTGIHDYDSTLAFQAFQTLAGRGELSLRVVKGIPHECLSQAVALGLRTGFGGDLLRLGAVKMFADGALGPQTAWMLEPYEGRGVPPAGAARSPDAGRGISTLSEEQMLTDIALANAAGLACAVHAIGDAACRAMLSACERTAAEGARGGAAAAPPEGAACVRNRIEHAQLLHPDDLPRLARLGVVASMQPLHATSDMLIAERHWGARCAGAYAWRSLLESGAALAFGSDCPVEIPDPLAGIHAAVTRRRADGSPGPSGWRPGERISVEQAVRAYTLGAAFAAGRESDLGSIAPGKLADFTVFERDIFSIEPHEIRQAGVFATIVGGQIVFSVLQ